MWSWRAEASIAYRVLRPVTMCPGGEPARFGASRAAAWVIAVLGNDLEPAVFAWEGHRRVSQAGFLSSGRRDLGDVVNDPAGDRLSVRAGSC
jgi:hypothetical protein